MLPLIVLGMLLARTALASSGAPGSLDMLPILAALAAMSLVASVDAAPRVAGKTPRKAKEVDA